METNKQIELAEQYLCSTGVSIFLTGKAGTGKTTFLKHIVKHVGKRLVVLAPTGVAAINAGGVTIHSFFQLPLCPYLPDVHELVTEYQLPDKHRQLRREKIKIIRSLDLVIIDEISMVRADLLDAIDMTLRRYRHSYKPFGGVQLLMIGDLHQLPPVVTDDEKQFISQVYPSPFFFHSKALQKLHYITIELQTIYRQQDPKFLTLLNHVRDNQFDAQTMELLNQRYIPNFEPPKSQNDYIRLTTHNHQADEINRRKLEELTTPETIFKATIEGNFPKTSAPTEIELKLKVGEQVMFVKNDSVNHSYYNGKIATIEAIDSEEGISVVDTEGHRFTINEERWDNIKYELDPKDNQIHQRIDGSFTQVPLRPACALTIHKAQGLTFDHVIIDAAAAFAYGQVYVALSRCRTLEGLVLSSPITANCAFDNSEVNSFHASFQSEKDIANQLPAYQSQYYFTTLIELFDFSLLLHHAESINSIYQTSLRSTYPTNAASFSDLFNNKLVDLNNVALRFHTQLKNLATQPNNTQIINERIAKASVYFHQQLSSLSAEILPLLDVDIDNTEVLQKFIEQSSLFSETLGLKLHCINLVHQKGFSVSEYLNAKVDFAMQKEKDFHKKIATTKSTQPKTLDYKEVRHPELLAILKEWRHVKADEQNIKDYQVFPIKTLITIANRLPQTIDELRSLSGIGKIKSKQYGASVLDVIADYCADNGIKFKPDDQMKIKTD